MSVSSINQKPASVGEDAEKKELSHIVGGIANWYSRYGKQSRGFSNN